MAHEPADCSHGPDPAPAGVDVRHRPSTAELVAPRGGGRRRTRPPAAGAVPCYGDGTSGQRLQAVYAVAADRTDRYAAVLDLVRGYAAGADQAFAASAARDGGTRHLRWVTDPGCSLSVAHVVLSAAGDDSLSATPGRAAPRRASTGPTASTSSGADATTYCGIAYVAGDARPDATNPANNGPTYARIDSGCWGGSRLGRGARDRPHARRRQPRGAALERRLALHRRVRPALLRRRLGRHPHLPLRVVAGAAARLQRRRLLQRGAAAGSWLASHWNLASSAFLAPVAPDGWSGPTATHRTDTGPDAHDGAGAGPDGGAGARPHHRPPPAPTRVWRVSRWEDRLTERHRARRHRVPAAAGALVVRLGLRGAPAVRVTRARTGRPRPGLAAAPGRRDAPPVGAGDGAGHGVRPRRRPGDRPGRPLDEHLGLSDGRRTVTG